MLNVRAPSLILVALLAAAAPAEAQRDGGIPEWVEADPFAGGEHDPLGVDQGDRLERVAPTRPEEEVREVVPVQRGEVLAAIAGVREEEHAVEVRLAHGLAIVETSMRFVSSARHGAELRYRLAVPEGASLAGLEVCNVRGCRSGLVDASGGPLGPYDDAVRSRGAGLPVAHAAVVSDERGAAIWLRAAPVLREGRPLRATESLSRTAAGDGPLTVRLRYVVAAPLRGGRVRLTLPARGRDVRAAPARVRVRSSELSGGAVAGLDAVEAVVERAASEPTPITASLRGAPEVALEALRVACGAGTCARLRAVAAPRAAEARDVVLLLDASPSTEGPARGRIAPAVATILAALPSSSRVRVAAFAARAEAVTEQAVGPTEVSLLEVARALEGELGSATRFEAAWALARPWVSRGQRPVVIVIGDGGLTRSEEGRRALAEAGRAAQLASVNVADRASTPALREAVQSAGGLVIDAGAEAEEAARGHGMEPLEERVAPLFAPSLGRVRAEVGGRAVDLGVLRAGEELSWEGEARGAIRVRARSSARAVAAPDEIALALRDRAERAAGRRDRPLRLAALAPESMAGGGTCGSSGVRSASGAIGRDEQLVLADTRRCDRPAVPEPEASAAPSREPAPDGRLARIARHEGRSGLPERSLLELLRQRIVPVARGCFREDRAGRPNYQTRAVFDFRLADREVVEADVSGRITPELRGCLLRAVDALEIPRFDGVVQVRYPIYTAPELPPPTLTLGADVADAVDAIAEP